MLNDNAYAESFLAALVPDPILSVSEWADEHRILSSKASSEPGKYRTDRTPYMREIMNLLSDNDPTREVVFMKAAQVGATEAGNNWLGYTIHHSPAPMMIVLPTVDLAKRNSKGRVQPLIEENPALSKLVKAKRSKDSSNTILEKDFPGGALVMTGANSAVGLRSMPAKKLFLDEVDGYPDDADDEGNPVELATARSRTFSRRKIFKVSTPTVDGKSEIQRQFEESDKRYYHVPCPECSGMQKLEFKGLHWDKDERGKFIPGSVYYQCNHCEYKILNWQKTTMLAQGQWIAEGQSKIAGFHINSLYSPVGWYDWEEIVVDWHKAQKDQKKLKTFVNTVLGECWKDKSEVPDYQRLYERRDLYPISTVPRGGTFLTAGVDVQGDRFEIEIVAWGRNKVSWSVDYRVIQGDTSSEKTWDELAKLLSEEFEVPDTPDGQATMGIKLMAIDSGYNTQVVYNWVRRFPPSRVIAVKGMDGLQTIVATPKAVDVSYRGTTIRRGLKVWGVGVNVIKSELYGWLRQPKALDGMLDPFGYCHFPQYGDEYFKMLTAEQLVTKNVKGYSKTEWQKHRERNEALDCRVYARAAAAICGLDRFTEKNFMELEQSLVPAVKIEPDKPARPTIQRKKSEFW